MAREQTQEGEGDPHPTHLRRPLIPPTLRVLPELPPAPNHIDELGLPERFIEDLVLKTLQRINMPTPVGVAQALKVSPTVVREAI
ncbi:MAG: hypothetical protein WEC33_09670, partial [Dehalococcoidia bacterium]